MGCILVARGALWSLSWGDCDVNCTWMYISCDIHLFRKYTLKYFPGACKKNKWLMVALMVGRQVRMKQEIFPCSHNSLKGKG